MLSDTGLFILRTCVGLLLKSVDRRRSKVSFVRGV